MKLKRTKKEIIAILQANNYVQNRAAKVMGISRQRVGQLLSRYGIKINRHLTCKDVRVKINNESEVK